MTRRTIGELVRWFAAGFVIVIVVGVVSAAVDEPDGCDPQTVKVADKIEHQR